MSDNSGVTVEEERNRTLSRKAATDELHLEMTVKDRQ